MRAVFQMRASRQPTAGASRSALSDRQGVTMRILVAGDRGYIGAVLVPFLRAAGHVVDGLDLGLYEGCDLFPLPAEAGPRVARDLRDVQPGEVTGYDAVMCL